MIDLPEPPPLSPERTRLLREQLVTTMLADPPPSAAPGPVQRARPLVAGALVLILLIGGGLAAAIAITVTAAHRSTADTVVVDPDMLDVLYDGHRITQDDLVALSKDGRGTFATTDVDTERDLHATRAFDTLDELDEYSAAYLAWQKAKADGRDVEAWGTVRP